jgi:hypothetical protein
MRELPLTAAEELLEIVMRRYERANTEHLMDGIKTVRGLLKQLMTKCRCDTLGS